MKRTMTAACMLIVALTMGAANYYVSSKGNDANKCTTEKQALATIMRGAEPTSAAIGLLWPT